MKQINKILMNKSTAARIAYLAVLVVGLFVIGYEIISFFEFSNPDQSQSALDHQKRLLLLESEIETEIRHLNQVFPAFVKSGELMNKAIETTLVGPYFVYSPNHYGQAIDYWDQVQLLKRQVWTTNYFSPLLQSGQLDHLSVYLLDPHNNLINFLEVPFIELQRKQVVFYSYPIKGLFQQFKKHQQASIEKFPLTESYFEKIIYNAYEKSSLHASLGFEDFSVNIENPPKLESEKENQISVEFNDNQIAFKKFLTLKNEIYNWKTQKREVSPLMTLVAKTILGREDLIRFTDKFDMDGIQIKSNANNHLSTFNNLQVPEKNKGTVQFNDQSYIFHSRLYRHPSLARDLTLTVLSKSKNTPLNSATIVKGISVIVITVLLLGILSWRYFKLLFVSAETVSINNAQPEVENLSTQPETIEPDNERFLLIEDQGKSQTIPLDSISHIRVADHYCTIFYQQDEKWNSWMIMEPLKTFEKKYETFFIKINRSTLVNPNRIEKVQLLQRKLTMQGEPENLMTISQTSLEVIKEIINSNSPSSIEKS